MSGRIERLDNILVRFDPHLKESRDAQHLSSSSLLTEVLLMAQELLKVKSQLKSGAQIVGQDLDRIDDKVWILDKESQRVQESFATTVAERLEETDDRQARYEGVTSLLHETVQGTKAQSMYRDLLLNQEIVRLNGQHQWELENHEQSINLMKQEMLQHQDAQQARDGEILELKAMVQTLMGQGKGKGKGKASDRMPEASRAGGGKPPPPPARRAAGPLGGGGDRMSSEKGVEESKTKVGNKDGTRAAQPS